ncbi:M28 family peptidase [Modestobacter sp. I12A-02628]|uniref:M28 family peptidase n=2 Tax=Goekera deserti TaxID=2497753 RepID=A0A7K3WGA8_9ACTN|nr:M28 family metallopeptidase [Goekera deserti]MPQ96481.1 M28 family peptidase [Goekera deserti]NDI47204.1 M28 family peptidase [Goekera deserti]NEL55396.1 M28 family peptidase [Goekera deserti]
MSLRPRRTGLTLATATAALASSLLVAAPAVAAPHPNPNGFANRVSTEEVLGHLRALQGIADANGGNRASGTPGYDASGDYVQGLLEDAGYQVERQPFEFTSSRTLTQTLTVGGQAVDVIAMTSSPSGTVQGPLSVLAAGDATPGCEATDYGTGTAGSVVLVSRGGCAFAVKQQLASAAGAVGVVVYNNTEGPLNGTLGATPATGAPAGGITQAAGQALLGQAGAPTTLAIDIRTTTTSTFNIVAQTPYGDADNVIMMGAHLDSVDEGPGINDNGTGSAAILQTALELAQVAPTRNAVRFAWWGAEESGLIGSSTYVDSLTEAERAQITGYLNFDMVGSPNYVIGVYDSNQSTYPAPVAVPAGSESLEQVFTDYFDRKGQPWVDTEFSGRSDYQGFIEAGIPATGLFTGAEQLKTPEEAALFGGTAGVAYDPNYHSPGDTIANVSTEALGINSKAIAFATLTLADDPTPLVVGDEVKGTSHAAGHGNSAGRYQGHLAVE